MKRHRQTIFLLAILILAGCSPSIVAPQQATATENSAETQIVLTSTPMPTPSLEVVTPIVEKIILPPEQILNFQPLSVSPELPSDVKPSGMLVIWGETLQLVHFDPERSLETISGIEFDGCLSTSPDGKWLAHCPFSDNSPTGQWLITLSADQQQEKKIPLNTRLLYFNNYLWLDNQHLIFPVFQDQHRPEAYPMMVINPFTGEQITLDASYPDFHFSFAGPESRMDFGYSDVVYDPSLNLVIFPSAIGGSYIVLWDRQSKSVLAKVDGAVGYYPLWSPDASQFAVPLLSPKESENIIEEWFGVSRSGQVDQLTHFEDYFISAEVGPEYRWSPDSQKLAFWLDVNPSLCIGLNLAVLDIPTKQVTNTCIPGRANNTSSPVWSLDSRYIVVNSFSGSRQTILVDTKENRGFDITGLTGGSWALGWLVER